MDNEIVLVCHCKTQPQVYYTNTMTPVGEGVMYVDPVCPGDTWDKIADNSKTYVWGVNCPVITAISRFLRSHDWTTEKLTDILINSHRVLKNGGKVVFPGRYDDSIVSRLQSRIDTNKILRDHGWIFSIENSEEFPLSLLKHNTFLEPKLAVFTKSISGMGGFYNIKRRNTNRRRYKNRRTNRKSRR